MKKAILAASVGLLLNLTPAYALIPNGDFETGDLTGYKAQHDFLDVPSSPLVKNVDDGTGNHVGEVRTGFTSDGVTISSLYAELGTLPADVQDLIFDVQFVDVGEDNPEEPPILALNSSPEFTVFNAIDPDILNVNLGTDSGNFVNFFALTSSGYTAGPDVQVESLSNGFYRVKTNVSSLASAQNSNLYFDLTDGDDLRLSKVNIDNIDLTTANQAVAPEPASMLLMGAGLAGFGYLRKKKLV